MQSTILDFQLFALADFGEQNAPSKRSILVLSTEPEKEHFLLKILGAAKLTAADFVIVQIPPSVAAVSVAQLRAYIAPKDILIFGIAPTTIGLQIAPPQYLPLMWAEARWLFAHSLEHIEKNPNTKKVLWAAIQKMYLS